MGKKRAGGVRVKQVGPKGGAPKNPMDLMPSLEDFAIKPEDQIHLPPTPDRNYSIVWPIQETFSMKPQDEGFQVIYPSYLDAEKTVKLGRRICQDKAVPKPTVSDLSLALQALQVRHVLQPYKGYSRDPATLWDNPGRVVVDVAQYRKTALLTEMANRIPHLPERQQRLRAEAEQAAALEEKMRLEQEQQKLEAAKTKVSSSSAAAGTSKKKGKKGRKK